MEEGIRYEGRYEFNDNFSVFECLFLLFFSLLIEILNSKINKTKRKKEINNQIYNL